MVNPHYPELRLERVLVTGGAEGIGLSIVEAFVAQGAEVGVLDINRNALNDLAARCSGLTCEAVDLRDIPATRDAIARLESAMGAPSILVNNAAHDERHAVDALTPDAWDERIAVNLKHVLFVTQAVLPAMRAAGRGTIINMGSNSWMKGSPGMIAYTTAKAAITGLTRSLAREAGTDGIRVNAIAPGWVMTERQLTRWSTPEKRAANLAAQCLKHEIAPRDIALTALFLASQGARSITGQTIIVDGGITYG